MPEIIPPTVPAQPVSNPPLKKGFPLVLVLVAIVLIIGLANLSNLVGGKAKTAKRSALTTQPSTITPQQVKSYQTMQATEATRDAEKAQTLAQNSPFPLQSPGYDTGIPGPEADSAAPMTAAQKQAIYGDSPNAPKRTSNGSQAHAEGKQRELARAKERQDAIDSDTVAIDFAQQGTAAKAQPPTAVMADRQQGTEEASAEDIAAVPAGTGQAQRPGVAKNDPMSPYPFDQYQGQLYRVFEGTVFEGVVTNHIDGALAGPMIVMLTTDYYSHDHQQLLLPQGTRLLGDVKNVGGSGQRKLMVVFNRAICPDGFSVSLNNFTGLDPIGTTGLATNVNNHYLSSFAAAAVIGGIGGLAQIGNSSSVLDPSSEIRNGISEQTAQESEQILNKFLNRLPTITVKEGSRARIYINRDIAIPSYAEHRVDPTL